MSSKKDCEDLAKLARLREHSKRVYAAAEEKARLFGGGRMTITKDDLERVSPDALAEGGTGARGQAHGGLFLR